MSSSPRRAAISAITRGGAIGIAAAAVSAAFTRSPSAFTSAIRASQSRFTGARLAPSAASSAVTISRTSPRSGIVGRKVRPCSSGSESMVIVACSGVGRDQFIPVFWLTFEPHQITRSASLISSIAAQDPSGFSTPAA